MDVSVLRPWINFLYVHSYYTVYVASSPGFPLVLRQRDERKAWGGGYGLCAYLVVEVQICMQPNYSLISCTYVVHQTCVHVATAQQLEASTADPCSTHNDLISGLTSPDHQCQ